MREFKKIKGPRSNERLQKKLFEKISLNTLKFLKMNKTRLGPWHLRYSESLCSNKNRKCC